MPVKQELAFGLKKKMEDRQLRIPKAPEVRDDFHGVRKVTTVAGNIRFDAERTDEGSHSDRFFAAALAVHALDASPLVPMEFESTGQRRDCIAADRFLTGGGVEGANDDEADLRRRREVVRG